MQKWFNNDELLIKPGGTAGKNRIPVPAETNKLGRDFCFSSIIRGMSFRPKSTKGDSEDV